MLNNLAIEGCENATARYGSLEQGIDTDIADETMR